MFVKLVPGIIQEKLKAKERALSHKADNRTFGDEDIIPITSKDIQSRTTFVRMCSNKNSVINKIIVGGELKNTFNDEATEVATTELLFGKSLYQKKKNGQIKPISGLKSIEVVYKSTFKAIREATVNWVAASLDDLDEFTPYFLTPGKTVALDWGWINSNVKSGAPMFNGETPFITYDEFAGSWLVDQSIFNNPQTKIQNAGGDYDALAGKISNFETTLRPDGGFDCQTKITAIGASLFSTPTDKPSNQTQIETVVKVEASNDEGATGDTKPKTKKVAYDVDNLMNAIINLKSIIYDSVFKLRPDIVNAHELLYKSPSVIGVSGEHQHNGEKHGFAVDDSNNPQVLWMTKEDKEDIFVKWGYMEDQILNRYVAVKGGRDNEVKMTIRSIDTVIDVETGLPKLIDNLNDFIIENPGNQPIIPGVGATPTSTTTPTKPYYPFIGDYYNTEYASVRREALADKIAEQPYSVYKSKPLAERKQDWDNSPELHNITELPTGETVDSFNDEGEVYGPSPAPTLSFGPPKIKKTLEIYDSLDRNNFETTEADSTSTAGVQKEQIKEFLFPTTDNRYLEEQDNTLSVENLGDTLKSPVLIRNSKKFLKPKVPFKFFSTELLPTFDEVNEFKGKGSFNKLGIYITNLGGNVTDLDFKKFYNALRDMEDHKFTNPQDETTGRLRYMWVNIKEIQKAFGVIHTKEGTIPTVKPKGTLEQCLKSLLSQLNINFYNFWDFELTVDPYDPSNIKVMDKKIVNISTESLNYTKFKENSHKVSQLGIFKFPTFQAGSMVKNQSLAFKIPDSMAITVMFGANKEDKKNEGSNKFNNPEIMKFFGNTQGLEYEDEYLYNLTSASVSKSEKATFANVGSENTNHNSRIVEGQGLTIRGTSLWSQWTGDEVIEGIKADKAKRVFGVRTKFEIIDDNLVYMKEEAIPFSIFDYETWLGDAKKETAKYQQVDEDKTPSLYAYKGGNLILKKEVEKVIRNRLNNGPIEKEKEDSLASDTIIPAELSLEIDGIGGMVPGDAIQTNYIQPQYNTTIELKGVPFGPYTYFQIFGLNQRVDAATWTTELVTKMRINHIPANDDVTFVKEAEEDEEEILENIEEPAEVKKIEEQVDDHVELPRIVKNEPIDPDDYENVEVVDINGKTTIPIRRANGIMGTYDYWVDTQNLISLNKNKVHLSTASTGVVQQGSTYNKLQLNMIKDFERKLPKGEAPTRNIPGEEVDIGKFEKLKNDFDKLEYFDLEKAPEMVIKVIVEKKIEVQKKKKAKEQKVNPKKPDKSTYGGRYEQNSWLYQIREDWRTLYRKQSGTGINSLSGQKQSYNPKQYTTVNNKQVEAYNIVRAQQPFSVRKAWWDENIEAPNASGKSVLTSLADIDLQSIRETGFLRQDKGIYWTGKYNPNI